MDISTILGILIGFGFVGSAMALGGGFLWFVNIPSIMIVLGGTIGAVLINYPMADVVGMITVAKNVLFQKEQKTEEIIALFVDLAKVAQREGLLALEHRLENIPDPFFNKGIMLMVDGTEPGTLSKILYTELDYIKERHDTGAEMFTTMGNFAPAMGMVGTLIGLVKMLMQMDDPSNIGPAMAVAMITTFYGVLLANLVCMPIAGKLKRRSATEMLTKELGLNGILAVQSGDNPRVVEQKLHSFISPGKRKSAF